MIVRPAKTQVSLRIRPDFRVHTSQGNSGNYFFFQGQGIVMEFHIVSGKNEILSKCQGILHFSSEMKERKRFSFSK